MLQVNGVVVGIKENKFKGKDGKELKSYTYHIGDPEGGDPVKVSSYQDGRKFGDKVVMSIYLRQGKNGATYLNEVAKK